MCEDREALIKAQRVQIAARRHRMEKMAAELDKARRACNEVWADLAAYRERAKAESG